MEKDFDRSVYQEKDKLAFGLSIMTPKQLANDIGVSVKLINVWAVKHGLLKRTPEMNFP